MNIIPYPLAEWDHLHFRFASVSLHKTIQKVIIYSPLPDSNFYNLALLDENEDGTLDDLTVSDNQDMPRVLATVIASIHIFFQQHPTKTLLFQGSTPARTRLYRVAISQNLALFEETFIVKGLLGKEFESFHPNRSYRAFSVSLKK